LSDIDEFDELEDLMDKPGKCRPLLSLLGVSIGLGIVLWIIVIVLLLVYFSK